MKNRAVVRIVKGMPARDGAGVSLTRVIGSPELDMLDPFLLLDSFASDDPDDYIAGFPPHPHRGFETVTYMLAGRMRHRDSAGHEGLLQGGGVQWMTAGRGVIHSELPEQTEGLMEGFQLWLNLPARDKMTTPWYRDIQGAEIPEWQDAGVTVRIIGGASHGVAGAVQREATQALYLDVHLDAGAAFEQTLPAEHNAFVYVYRGAVVIGETAVPQQRMAILLNQGDGVCLKAAAQGARALLIAGRPLREPIAQHGPFVMNTQQELVQAIDDFRAGRLA